MMLWIDTHQVCLLLPPGKSICHGTWLTTTQNTPKTSETNRCYCLNFLSAYYLICYSTSFLRIFNFKAQNWSKHYRICKVKIRQQNDKNSSLERESVCLYFRFSKYKSFCVALRLSATTRCIPGCNQLSMFANMWFLASHFCTTCVGFKSLFLVIADKARVNVMPKQVYAGISFPFTLHCPAMAVPPVNKVKWRKDGHEIDIQQVSTKRTQHGVY